MAKKNNNIIAVLDIGTTKICSLIAQTNEENELKIIGEGTVPSEGLKSGMVVDLAATTHAIEESVSKAESMANVQVDKIVISLAGKNVQCQNSRAEIKVSNPLRGITEDDVKNVVDQAKALVIPDGRELLHILVQEFFVDDQGGIRNPIGIAGSRLAVEVHIITGAIATAQNISKCVNEAGWKVENVVLQPLASAMSTLTEDERNLGVIMADMGGGTIDMAVYSRGGLRHTQVIPMGGDYISSDIAYGLRVSRTDAENLKRKYGCAAISLIDRSDQFEIRGVVAGATETIPRQRLVEIIAPRTAEMLTLVKEELGQVQNKYRNPAGVVLTGGVTLMPGVKEVAEKVFMLPVRVASPIGFHGFTDVIGNPVYSTAVGLVQFQLADRAGASDMKKNFILGVYGSIRDAMDKYL